MAKTIFTKDPAKYIPALAEALKQIPEFQVPEWALIVKTGVSKERPSMNDNFWYMRAASILRQLYIKGVVGVGRLRTRYGSKKNRGGRKSKFFKAGGKIIRTILQQAEKAGLIEKLEGAQFGRRLTQKGRDFLDSINVEAPNGIDLESVKSEVKEVPQEQIEEINEGEDDGEETQQEE
jgi:small subunit ribosomal protein S19e